MCKRARLIYNPTAGAETLKKNIPDILNIFEHAGYDTSSFQTTPEHFSAKKEAHRAALKGFDLIIAAGGDGTINEVVNGIAGLVKRPRLAIIPAGTTNDYARALRIPRNDPVAAANIVLKHKLIKMDIGTANNNYFMNIAAGGLLTELTYYVPSEIKSIFGYLAYLIKAAEMIPNNHTVPVRLEYDNGIYEGEMSMFFLGLTNSVGGFEQASPDILLGSGEFSLIIVKTANVGELIRLLSLAINGKHVKDPRIIYTKTKELMVVPKSKEPMKINLDGEYGGEAPMRLINLKQHIEIFANVDEIPKSALCEDATINICNK